MKRRAKIVRHYRAYRRTAETEHEAAQACALRFDCGKSTIRRYHKRWLEGGRGALMPRFQQKAPRARLTLSERATQVALALRTHLGWCGQRIAHELSLRGLAQVSHSTIYRLFRRYHVRVRTYHPVGKRDGINYRKQSVKAPNWTWHVDFAGPLEDANREKKSVLIVIDSYSRMLLALEVVEDQRSETVASVLESLFEQYGKPRVLITDNARCFAPVEAQSQHRFAQFMADQGVEHRLTKPYYPQTNGKAEAMVKTFKRECMARLGDSWSWSALQGCTEAFRAWYNFYRSHGSLGYGVPARFYAGISLVREGLKNIFGFLPESAIALHDVPAITAQNRCDRLALVAVS
jgi:transposase InsO family protein